MADEMSTTRVLCSPITPGIALSIANVCVVREVAEDDLLGPHVSMGPELLASCSPKISKPKLSLWVCSEPDNWLVRQMVELL